MYILFLIVSPTLLTLTLNHRSGWTNSPC